MKIFPLSILICTCTISMTGFGVLSAVHVSVTPNIYHDESGWSAIRTGRQAERPIRDTTRYRRYETVAVIQPDPILESSPKLVAKPRPAVSEPEVKVATEPKPESAPEVTPVETVIEPEKEAAIQNQLETNTYLVTVQTEVHRLTNEERARAGVAPLRFDTQLAQIAEAHSEDMSKQDYFSHTSPDGCNAGCRYEEAGYEVSAWGENIAWRSSSVLPSAEALAEKFVDSWMNSSGHRKNILSEKFTHEGIGLYQEGNKVYATANFADPR